MMLQNAGDEPLAWHHPARRGKFYTAKKSGIWENTADGKPEFPATYWDLTKQYYIYSHFTDILYILGHAVKKSG